MHIVELLSTLVQSRLMDLTSYLKRGRGRKQENTNQVFFPDQIQVDSMQSSPLPILAKESPFSSTSLAQCGLTLVVIVRELDLQVGELLNKKKTMLGE